MPSEPASTDTDMQFLTALDHLLQQAASEPETVGEEAKKLWAIQDAAAQAVADDLA